MNVLVVPRLGSRTAVSFGCDVAPASGQRVDQWDVPAVSDGYDTARGRIVEHVERLITELAGVR